MSTLDDAMVRSVLRGLHARAAREDPAAAARVREREAELGVRLPPAERYAVYGDAPLAISPEVGRLLYVLARTAGARLVVEFGMSHGISTIYLAAAVHDNGGGTVVTTEVLEDKVQRGRANLTAAGLSDLVEIRVGDALKSLVDLIGPVDMLVLDGRNDQYEGVLEVVRPRLRSGALVVADLGKDDPDLQRFQRHLAESGLTSVEVPLDAGVEVAVWDP